MRYQQSLNKNMWHHCGYPWAPTQFEPWLEAEVSQK